MKILNLLICKLYDNFSFGINRPSIMHFYTAQLSVSFIILYWLSIILYFFKTTLNLLEYSFTWLYVISFLIIFYVLNRNTVTLIQVEEIINDDENKKTLSNMIWVFWLFIIIPTIFLILISNATKS